MRRMLSLLLAMLLLCGCAAIEEPKPVFDASAVEEAVEITVTSQRLIRTEDFQNADASAEFHVKIDTTMDMEPMAVIEAVPRELTAQDARDLIYAFFPNASCYERHPKYTSPETYWTKAELEKNMERWRAYDYEDLVEIYGGVDNLPDVMRPNGDDVPFIEHWEESLAYFEELLEKVPEEDQRTPSLWHMFKETEYMVEPEEAERMDLSKDRDCIQANVVVGDDHYYYVVANANPLSGNSNLISLSYNTPDSPANIDWDIFLAENDALPAPSQEDLDKAKRIAQSYLEKLSIGDWVLEEPTPSEHDGTIYISAHPQDPALPEAGDVLLNASASQLPRMSIRIHPDGRLLNFGVSGSLAGVTVRAQNAAELPMETLVDTALNHMKQKKSMAYGISEEDLRWVQIWKEEDVRGQIEVTGAIRGYARLDTPAGGICYTPCLALMGNVSYIGIETGTPCDPDELPYLPMGEIPLVVVNAIDGTMIPIPQ